ncbi:hypothetical protein NC652_037401 [Populus alba x Populus x berolinensis]|uniref:Uncharacterized protein n=1 Tax=Populus alba x Populus x berolinensis TaxID=444605 RepID=A0AAD6LE72_9ROSI|nr:hypothetical protein NC652_037401 [Populus alba x Populus x berolinensis]KAJ6958969.1 hypothetical protein NC653_037291 [Populus alba x Populus x berolinensis]
MAYYLFPRRSARLKRQLYTMVGKGPQGSVWTDSYFRVGFVVSGPTTSPELRDHKFHFINGGMERDKKKPILCNACLRLLHFTPGMADTCESEFIFGDSFLQISISAWSVPISIIFPAALTVIN